MNYQGESFYSHRPIPIGSETNANFSIPITFKFLWLETENGIKICPHCQTFERVESFKSKKKII